jgi:murein L,D-transpeptidase YcbB/YkuD
VTRAFQSSLRLTQVAAILFAATLAGCKKTAQASGEVSRNWTPPAPAAVLDVPMTAITQSIQKRLASPPPPPVTADQWKHTKKLYGTFNQVLLWLDEKGVHQPRVAALLNAIASADSDALRLDAFPLADLNRSLSAVDGKHPTAEQLADADVMLSAAFTAFGEIMLTGQTQPAALGQSWHINPLEERVDSALALTLREDDFAAGLVRMRPQGPGYDSLRVQLVHFRELVNQGGWGSVPAGKALKRGDSDSPQRIAALRARLHAEGFLADSVSPGPDSAASAPTSSDSAAGAETSTAKTGTRKTTAAKAAAAARAQRTGPGVFDGTLAGAVAEFQARHGIVVDSMLGTETLDAMNIPPEYRLAQIAANLERHRWMPRSLGRRYIMVNVPQFHLEAFDSGQKALEMKVIVGKDYEDKATPVFSDSMEFVVFRPYWNVTPDIAAKEIFPKEQSSPGYLAANNMQVYDDQGRKAVRQRPGPKNSLGLVKFMFPNDYNIYLHDTPDGELFKKDVRAFSHGCIRLEKPAELAQWVLGWPEDKVQQAMRNGPDNHQVNLPKKIPVYIVYFTTYVSDGKLFFGNDLYDRDSKLVTEVEGAASLTPEAIQARDALRAMAKS